MKHSFLANRRESGSPSQLSTSNWSKKGNVRSGFLLVFCFQWLPVKYQLLNVIAPDTALDCMLQLILSIDRCQEM
jgi:hypothetical protein